MLDRTTHSILLRRSSPIFDFEVRHLAEVAHVAGDDSEAVLDRNSCDAKVLTADTDTTLSQLSKDSISLFREGEDVPRIKIVESLDEGSVTLSRLMRVISVRIHVGQPPLHLFFDGDRSSEELFAGGVAHFRAEDRVRVLGVCDGVGVEDEHR